ncbi:MAG TPA: hypothetical protein VE863_02155 [Pyrinomonadaceae bacterium]|jgi:hypothetical protein|nr:hypothetical protein [Pyrinomonadaceae bacterium]
MTLGTSLASRKYGVLLLGAWLILTGLLPLLSVRLSPTFNTVMDVLAIAAGLMILLGR